MKRIVAEPGGRPPMNDDFMALQELVLTGSGAPLLASLPTCVVSGCAVTPAAAGKYNVGAGLVWLPAAAAGGAAAGIYDFPGAAGVDLPGNFLLGATVAIDQRAYETGGTKTCISDTKAELEGVDDGPGMPIYPDGPVFWYDYLAARTRALGTIEFGLFDLAGYDNNGKGLGRNRGWHLANGRGGTQDMQGFFPLVLNQDNPDRSQRPMGYTGGEEEHTLNVFEMPDHQHQTQVVADPGGVGMGNALAKTSSTNPGAAMGRTQFLGGPSPRDTNPHNNMPPFIVVGARQWLGL